MSFLSILALIALTIGVSLKLDTIIHELGHALTGVWFSRAEVTVYIGSFGDKNKTFNFKLGLIQFFVKYNLVLWKGGLCTVSNPDFSTKKHIIFILMGPILPFLVSSILFGSSLYFEWHGAAKFATVIFFGVTIFTLFQNLIPSKKGVAMYKGHTVYNDGFQLKKLLGLNSLTSRVQHATSLYNEEKYADAAEIFENILTDYREVGFFKLAISSHLILKNHLKAKQLSDEFRSLFKFDADDYCTAGIIYSHLEIYEAAIEFYTSSLEINPNHIYSLNNFGFTLNIINEYEKAISLFDQVINLDPSFAYAYNNRGLAKVMLGNHIDGLDDINRSFQLDNNNAYAHRNLGIYYLEIEKHKEALENFEKAKMIDVSTHQIDLFLEKAKLKLYAND